MDEKWKQLVLTVIMSVMMPGALLHAGGRQTGGLPQTMEPTQGTEPSQRVEMTAPNSAQMLVPVLLSGGEVAQMELETYIVGVVLGEMPASFETEALKAQAVAARTLTVRGFRMGDRHSGAAVCMDSRCCQAYMEPDAYLRDGGLEENLEKVMQAVASTAGQVLTYEGETIVAAYFSCSGGRTEDALAVWGGQVPYLQSVESPGEEQAEHYADQVFISKEELQQKLGIRLSGTSAGWIGPVTRTCGGGVATAFFGGKRYTGTELRTLLELNSTAFSMTPGDGGIYITTSGKGHRVGLSQWGANAMAQAGFDYTEILGHYYSKITIDKIENLL